ENNLDFIAADHFKWILMAGTHDNRALDRGVEEEIKYFQRAKDALFQMEHNKAYLSTKC
ncbi:hypothetical protein ACJX0J_039376, partial [Zea mays]